jgi:Ni/Co efflux regulator RcnB
MKDLMTAALALALMGGTSALADPPEKDKHPAPAARPAGQPARQGPAGGVAPGAARPAIQGGAQGFPGGGRGGAPGGGQGGAPGRSNGFPGADRGEPGRSGGYQGGAGRGGAAQGVDRGERGDRGAAGSAGARGGERSGGDRGERGAVGGRGGGADFHPRFGAPGFRPGGARPHYDARYFPRVFRPDHAFAWRGGSWYPQPGYYYRRWAYGDRLPYGWYSDRWYIDDYYDYDLAVPPEGYEWVRVGPDAMLVDLDDGSIVESVYGLFY